MNTTKHVVLLTSNIFGRGFDSRRLHHAIYYQLVTTCVRKPYFPIQSRAKPDFQHVSPLLGLSFYGRVFEFGDQLLESRVGVETLQIIVGHQGSGILISAMDGFL
jgi:hypothetical protein